MTMPEAMAGHVPAGVRVVGFFDHPIRLDGGALIQYPRGYYAMAIAGTVVSVPQKWAKAQDGQR